MQIASLTFKIELFGNLIEELNYWNKSCEEESDMGEGEDLQYCEDKFLETLRSVRDMRAILLNDFTEYKLDCKTNGTPIDLSYYRIERQLKESSFELLRP